jgi:hypothetical protein
MDNGRAKKGVTARPGDYGVLKPDERSDVVFFRAMSCVVSPHVGESRDVWRAPESEKRAAGKFIGYVEAPGRASDQEGDQALRD